MVCCPAGPHIRTSCVPSGCCIACVRPGLCSTRPQSSPRLVSTSPPQHAEPGRPHRHHTSRYLYLHNLRHRCWSVPPGGPRLCGRSTRLSSIGWPQLGQIITGVPLSSVRAGAGVVCAAIYWSSRNWLCRRARLRRLPTRNRPYYRTLTKPLGKICWRNRRRNSCTGSVQ